MKFLLLQPDCVFCHMKPKYCGKVWTYAYEDWQIPQIPINGDESAILASIPRGVGLISQSVHVRITCGACLEMHVTRPKLRLIRLSFRGRPVSDVCNSFPRDSWCQYLLRTGDPEKLKVLKTSSQHAILMDSGILLQLLHFILKACFIILDKMNSYNMHSCCSVTQSSPTLWDPLYYSMPGFHVLHDLPEFAQTHVHWVGDAIQPSHSLSFLSPPALNLF